MTATSNGNNIANNTINAYRLTRCRLLFITNVRCVN